MIRLTQLNEASEVFIEEIPIAKAKQVMAFEKVIGGKHESILQGIHGYIAYIKTPGGHGNYRFEADDLKKLLSLKIRWVEGDNEYVSIGF
jgi:uncharacterized protein YneR